MIQRDLKIGLVVGLVIVAGIIFLLATDPRLSTETRMMNLDDSIDGMESIDSNNIYVESDDVINRVPFTNSYSSNQNPYEQSEPLQQEESVTTEITEQNNNEQSDFPIVEEIQEQIPAPTSPSIRTQMELPVAAPQTPVTPEVVREPERIHVVQDGETLSRISSIYYSSPNQWQKIVDANPDVIKNPDKIKPGMRLVIP